ncbi:hypothetical protein L6273_02795, partial [Candidatus Parcubacteria bacterium]|nr:hypothetical protein [Candidatus Parcubacteria bacterium]
TWTFDAGATDPQLYLSSNIFAVQTGNIGIGTTSPLTKLHIEGQCITGDSLLPIVKKDSNHQKTAQRADLVSQTDLLIDWLDTLKKNISQDNSVVNKHQNKKGVDLPRVEPGRLGVSNQSSKPAKPTPTNNITQNIEYKKIKDIKGGEMILSLDETTGKIIPAKIKGLLDMGVKPIYRLTTQDGKSIKTTGNHPYLVRTPTRTTLPGRISKKSDISQKTNNHYQSKSDNHSNIKVNNINHNYSPNFLNLKAITTNTIPNSASVVKIAKSIEKGASEKAGTIKLAPNQPAERLINKSESVVNKAGSNFINNNLTKNNFSVKWPAMSNTNWTKVIYLSVGDEIAVADGNKLNWQKIKSIEELPPQQVYDIEVENTHNFVANGIIAHNTYISDKLGIGATNASYQLNVSGSGNITTNLNIGGTLTLGNLNIGSSYVLTSASGASGGQVAYLDTTSWDKDNTNDITTLQEAYGIDITGTGIGRTIAFDSTEIISTTWGSAFPFTWTFNTGDTNPQIQFANNVTNIATGYLAIGTTDPNESLHINGRIYMADSSAPGTTTNRLYSTSGNLYWDGTQLDIGASSLWTDNGSFIHANNYTNFVVTDTGYIGIGTTGPSYKLHINGSENLLALSVGDTNIATITQTQSTFNNPSAFNASGDVEIAYNLNFSNDTANYIRSLSPLYIEAGDPNSAEDLTLRSRGSGNVIIENSSSYIKQIGDNLVLNSSSNVGINNTSPGYDLDVTGDIRASNAIYVGGTALSVPDYVFEDNYEIKDFSHLQEYISMNKHLPNLPSMNDISAWEKIDLQQRDMKILEKVEENVLYILQLNNRLVANENLLKEISVAGTGQLQVDYNINESVLTSLGYNATKNEIETAIYSLTDTLGNTVNQIGQFAKLASAKIQTGLLQATNIITKNIVSDTSISKTTKTAIISPLSDISDTIVVKGKLNITDTLTTKDIKATTATISTLFADNIIGKNGSFTEIMSDKITAIRAELTQIVGNIGNTLPGQSELLTESENWYTEIASNSATMHGNLTLTNDMLINAQLIVQGQTQLNSLLVTGTFSSGQIAIRDNLIETTNQHLYIQPSAIGSVHILGDTMIVAETGNVIINGNLTAKTATFSNSLFANLIETVNASISGTLTANNIESHNITLQRHPDSDQSDEGSPLLNIQGSAQINKINIATDSAIVIAESSFADLATSSAKLSTNATAGTATLPTGKTELIVYNNTLTQNSMVYLTPQGTTKNQVLYVKEKTESFFTIALDSPLTAPLPINWWIIN